MADEDGTRAKRAAETSDDVPGARPKRFVTPDWEDWDAGSGDTPDSDAADAPPAPGGRFASEPDEPGNQPPRRPGRYSWVDESAEPEPETPPAQPAEVAEQQGPPVQPEVEASAEGRETQESGTRAWRPIPVEPAPGASRAAQAASLGEKRRREAPALPSTPPPSSPAERRDALIARERAGRSIVPGTVPGDDWTDAPLPASAVPPPAVGHAPTPISVQQGEAPDTHRPYTRPTGGPQDDDTLWLGGRPSSRTSGNEPIPGGTPDAPETPPSEESSRTPEPSPTPAPVTATPAFVPAKPPAPASQGSQAVLSGPPTPPFDQQAPAGQLPADRTDRVAGTAETGGAGDRTSAEPSPRGQGRVGLLRRRPVQIGLAVLVVAVVLVAGFLVFANRSKPSAEASSQATAALVERLVTPTQLSGVGPGGWTEQKTESTVTQDSPAPLCFVAAPDLPTPTAIAQRKLAASGASLLHRIATYASTAEARQVYAQRLTQLGSCSNIPVYLSSGATVTSLGDEAAGVAAVIQDTSAQYHTVVIVRTGSAILTYDVAQAGSVIAYDKVAPVAAQTVTAICSSVGGGCAASPVAAVGIPPASSVPGWLSVSDLPRVTPGMGRWNATAPKGSVTTAGSACENLTFATVAGPNQRRQRTYLLTEDTKVPKDFGLDEVILDFDTPDAAAAFAAQLKTSIADCPNRTATAKLGNTADVSAVGAKGQAVTGFWRTVTQSTNATTTFVFRVGVASVGTRVVYLLATPSSSFDFTDAGWGSITARAGQRATQGG